MFFAQFEELNVITGTGPYLLYAGLIVDPVIEDILVLEEQDFNPSLVVVAVSGWDPVRGQCGYLVVGGRGLSQCRGRDWVLPRLALHTVVQSSGCVGSRLG